MTSQLSASSTGLVLGSRYIQVSVLRESGSQLNLTRNALVEDRPLAPSRRTLRDLIWGGGRAKTGIVDRLG